jgi:PAS domain S-box-containing protein
MGDTVKTILLVEDEALIALQEIDQLEKAGYKVIHTFTGAGSLEIVDLNPDGIDLILMDIDLGQGMDGTEAGRRILDDHDIPILFLSSHTGREMVRKTEEIVNYGYVVKSSASSVLEASIKTALGLFTARRSERIHDRDRTILKSTLDSQKDLFILSIDKDFNCLYVNEAYQDFRFRSLGQRIRIGTRLSDAPPADRFFRDSIGYFVRALMGESLRVVEHYGIDESSFESTYNPIYDEKGTVMGATSFSTDISERTRVGNTLRKSEEKWRSIVSASPDGIAELSKDGKIVFASPKCFRLIGYDSVEEVVGESMETFVDRVDQSKARSYLESLFSGKGKKNAELLLRKKDGSLLFTEMNPEMIKDGESDSENLILVIRDISERKEREQELRESHDRYRNLLNAIGEGFCYTDENEIFRMANPSCERIFGVEPRSLIGRSLNDFLDDEGREIMVKETAPRENSGSNGHIAPIIRPDGQRRWLRINTSPINSYDDRYVGSSVVLIDVTDELKSSEALNRLVKNTELLMKELEHRVKNSLSIASSLIGIARDEITDRRALDVLKDTDSRIRSMSAIYERLCLAGSVQSIDFGTYVENLAKSILGTYYHPTTRIALNVRAQHIEIDTKRAISLGLIVNELLTNAVKHAFPDGSSGTIAIGLRRIGDSASLTVSDDGVGLRSKGDIEESASMGMMLIRELVKQIGGVLEIDDGEGTSVSIVFGLTEAGDGRPG